jgi:hypothetical protein
VNRPIFGGCLLVFLLVALAVWGKETKDTTKAAEARKKLQQKVTVDYTDMSLQDVVDDLKTQVAGLGIRLDTAHGVSQNIKIKFKAADKTLAEVLDGMFKKNGLGYVVVSEEGTAYDGTLLIKQGKERGYALGQEPDKSSPKEKPKPGSRKTAKKDKPAENPSPPPTAKEKDPEKAADKTEDDEEKAEREANQKLNFAKTLAHEGKTARAKQRLEDLIAKYPKTKAAREAKELLKDLDN